MPFLRWTLNGSTRARVYVLLGFVAGVVLVPGSLRADDEAKQVANAVENTLRRHAPEVHRCFERALADRLDVAGKLEIEVILGKGGAVKQSRVVARASGVPEGLALCVGQAVRGWRIADVEPESAVVLPFSFAAETNQFVVRAEDLPERGPAGKGGKPGPFSLRILADAVNVRARHLSATLLSVSPASRVAMHRHPHSDKLLYVLRGRARILGPEGFAALSVPEGSAVYVPRGFPHAIENMGRQLPVDLLQVFSPPGPEKVYRDPADPAGRAAFEVVRDTRPALPAGARPLLVDPADTEAESLWEGTASVRTLLGAPLTEASGLTLNVLELAAGAAWPEDTRTDAEEFLYVVSGAGVLSVGKEEYSVAAGHAATVPPGQARGGKAGAEKLALVQILALPPSRP